MADWANFGVYEKNFSLAEESRIGIQGTAKFSDALSGTAQVVSRGTKTTPDLTWAYLGYKITPNLELQVGRKRIPLYYYSDFQDIGVAYPWVAPPPELYGWDATNYNGASLRYKTTLGSASVSASLLAGSEKIKDDRYFLINPSPNNEHRWKSDHEPGESWNSPQRRQVCAIELGLRLLGLAGQEQEVVSRHIKYSLRSKKQECSKQISRRPRCDLNF